MSHYEFRLNRRFWRSNKVLKVVQIDGMGGGGIIWTKSKRTATFFSWNHLLCTSYVKVCFEPHEAKCKLFSDVCQIIFFKMKTKFCNYFPSRGSRSVSTCGLAIWARLKLRISSTLLRLFGGGKHYIFHEDNSKLWTFLVKYVFLRHTDKDQLTWVGEGRPELEFQVYDSGFWPLP